ncbi:MAG TPA: hypothetical protein VM659_00910 [Dongiaceae bacterium]|nr:hypothetical protein [Dongiaceae bacterium]
MKGDRSAWHGLAVIIVLAASTFGVGSSRAADPWRLLTVQSGDLGEDRIVQIFESADGALWELGRSTLRRIKSGKSDGAGFSPSDRQSLSGLEQTADGRVWLLSNSGSLFEFKEQFVSRHDQDNLPANFEVASGAIIGHSAKQILVLLNGNLIRPFDLVSDRWATSISVPLSKDEKVIFDAYLQQAQRALFVTSKGRILYLEDGERELHSVAQIADLSQFSVSMHIAEVNADSAFLLATNAGILRLTYRGATALRRSQLGVSSVDDSNPESLIAPLAWTYDGRDKALWVATGNTGVVRLTGSGETWFDASNGLAGSAAAVSVATNGDIYVGSDNGAITTVSNDKVITDERSLPQESEASAASATIVEVDSGLLAIGKDCSVRSRNEEGWRSLPTSRSNFKFANTSRDGTVWIICSGGAYRYSAGHLVSMRIDESYLQLVRQFMVLSNGDAALGLFGKGLLVFSASQGTVSVSRVDNQRRIVEVRLESNTDSVSDWSLYYSLLLLASGGTKQQILLTDSKAFNSSGIIEIPMPDADGTYRIDYAAISRDGDVARNKDGSTFWTVQFSPTKWQQLLGTLKSFGPYVPAAHVAIWFVLFSLYPISPTIQAMFFWNDKMRSILGLWYVDLLLMLPVLRTWLFLPFREQLRSDAIVVPESRYFGDIDVTKQIDGNTRKVNLNDLPQQLRGHVLLRGRSGAGKTYLLRWALGQSSRMYVYVQATACKEGIERAIAETMPSALRDSKLLGRLIYVGALSVMIDGLNEADTDTRAAISRSLRDFPKATIVVASQPTAWRSPRNMLVYDIEPLSPKQVGRYLTFKGPSNDKYISSVNQLLSDNCVESEFDTSWKDNAADILSNPFDLDLLVSVLVKSTHPTIINIVRTYFELCIEEYEETYNASFPMSALAEVAYGSRLDVNRTVDVSGLPKYLVSFLTEKRILVLRAIDSAMYYFRHDKLQDFLILQHLEQHRELLDNNVEDVRFTGVYSLLASELPQEPALKLQSKLAVAAARNKEHSILDAFVLTLAQRDFEGESAFQGS